MPQPRIPADVRDRNAFARAAWNFYNNPRPSVYGNFLLQSEDATYRFEASFDDEAPLPTDDSYGGWAIVSIPKRMGLVEWTGRNPIGLQLNFLIDMTSAAPNADAGRYCARMFDQIEKLAGLHATDEEPPRVLFQSNGLCPHDLSQNRNLRWVVESLTWDRDRFQNNLVGRPLFIAGSLVIRQTNDDESMEAYKGPARRNRDRNKKNKRDRDRKETYEVKQGDTLQKIAAKKLGDAKRWREIADLNNIRHPRDVKPGDVLKLPNK